MMLFASVYGLRVCDIRTMKLSNIDWKRRLITLNQHKTGSYLELPIIQEVLLAMLDYVKNGRPNTTNPHIFIKQRSPQVPYSNNNHFANFISEYFEKAGVPTGDKRSGLHSMRHSLATSLLAEGVQINEIADILGHASPQSTTRYLWSDIEQLRAAALEVSPYVE
jgi:integrase